MGNGVFKLRATDKIVEHYIYRQEDPNTISSNSVSSVTEDRKGNLWFSTDRGGICKYMKETNSFKSYSKNEGLPDDVTYKIIEDNEGLLWFGTNHGMVRFNPETEAIQVFTEKDGINNNQFNYQIQRISNRHSYDWHYEQYSQDHRITMSDAYCSNQHSTDSSTLPDD